MCTRPVIRTRTHRGVKHIDGLDSSLALLFQTKHQVDPLAEHLRNLLRFKSLSVDQHEEPWVVPGPWWQIHMIHSLAILPNSKVKTWHRETCA